MKARFTQFVCVAFLAGFLGSQFAENSIQIKADEKVAKKADEKKADDKKATKEPGGRLPNYYAGVVDAKQRTEIYAIQAKYSEQIAGLEKQIGDLKTKMNDESRAVLSDEQKAKVDALAEEAKKKAGDKKKPKTAQ